MTPADDKMLRAVLGDLAEDETRAHRERLARDETYRAAFDRLARLRRELTDLPAPALAPGLEGRVLAELRARARPDDMVAAMNRQFWRLALPALVGAAVLLGLATRAGSGAGASEQVTLASWYPISADPTANR